MTPVRTKYCLTWIMIWQRKLAWRAACGFIYAPDNILFALYCEQNARPKL
jgi:hypothetical protein